MDRISRFLDFKQEDQLVGQMGSLAKLLERVVTRELEERHGFNLNEWRVLAQVATSDGADNASSAQQISARTGIDKGWISRSIARLLDQGLITRFTDPEDARRHRLQITEDGAAAFELGVTTMRQLQNRLLDAFDAEDHAAFVRLAARLKREAQSVAEAQAVNQRLRRQREQK